MCCLDLPCFLSRAVWIFWEKVFKQAGDMDNEGFCVCFGLNFYIELSSIRYYSSYRFIISELARSFLAGFYIRRLSVARSIGLDGRCPTIIALRSTYTL